MNKSSIIHIDILASAYRDIDISVSACQNCDIDSFQPRPFIAYLQRACGTSGGTCRGEWGNPEHLFFEGYNLTLKQVLERKTLLI